MLVCTADADVQPSPEEPVTSTDPKAIRKAEKQRKKKYTWKHGSKSPTVPCSFWLTIFIC